MEGADPEFIEAVQAIFQSIERENQARDVNVRAWARRHNEGRELRREAMAVVLGGLDPQ